MADQLLDDLKAAIGSAFQIERELSGGGMSRVFVAREQALGRDVVIKVLPPELAAGINHERFRREIQLAARLQHPYIVPLHHAGESGELLWFTMPYIPGESLKTRIEQKGPLPVAEVLALLRDVAEALAYAHHNGVIHRDIKPGNILSDGQHAQITDFGVAKALGASLPVQGVAGHTTSGMAIGTPAYMAPEQLAADPSADHRVDIYAMGLLAYELLSGDSPFAAPSPTATMTAQLTRIPDPLTSVRQDIPPAFSQLVERCLAKLPEERPADAQVVLSELDQISGALAADRHRTTSGESTANTVPAASQWPLLISAAAVVVLIGGGLWWSQQAPAAVPLAAAPDTVFLPSPTGDSSEAVALPSPDRPITRADSLAIAAALQDELYRIDPEAEELAGTVEITDIDESNTRGTFTLARQFARRDSLVRTKLAELSLEATAREVEAVGEMVTLLGDPEAIRGLISSSGELFSEGSEKRRVLVNSAKVRGGNPAHEAMSNAVVSEIESRLKRTQHWDMVSPSEEGSYGIDADVMVNVAVAPARGDSAILRISVRDAGRGSSYGFHVVGSDPVALADGPRAYRGTVREALAMMENLREVNRGDAWRFDMGELGFRTTVDSSGRMVIVRPPEVPNRDSRAPVNRRP